MDDFDDVSREIAAAMERDMASILHVYLGRNAGFYDLMLDELVAAGMFHVQHLLVVDLCAEQRAMIDHD